MEPVALDIWRCHCQEDVSTTWQRQPIRLRHHQSETFPQQGPKQGNPATQQRFHFIYQVFPLRSWVSASQKLNGCQATLPFRGKREV